MTVKGTMIQAYTQFLSPLVGPMLKPLKELHPIFTHGDDPVDLTVSRFGYTGPRIVLLAPFLDYYIASLVTHHSSLVCIDAGGLNFGIHNPVYIKLADLIRCVEEWRPGFWSRWQSEREELSEGEKERNGGE